MINHYFFFRFSKCVSNSGALNLTTTPRFDGGTEGANGSVTITVNIRYQDVGKKRAN